MLKFADTAEAMGNFPVALANGIEITKKDDTKKSLQAMYDDGELGGGEGLPLPEQANMVMMTYENEEGDLDWQQISLSTLADETDTTVPTTEFLKQNTYFLGIPEESIEENSDLNDFKTANTRFRVPYTVCKTLLNCPVKSSNFRLTVYSISITTYVTQLLETVTKKYIRYWNGTKWSAWEKFLTDADDVGGDAVIKVEEMPTTFENKVYVHSGGTQVKEELLTLNPMISSTTFPTAKFEEDIAKIDAICDKFGITYIITEEGTNVRNVNFSYDGLFTLSTPEFYVDMPIKYLEFTRVNTAEWYWILHIGTTRIYTKDFNDKLHLAYKKETEAQVYASEVELATKEYADTHGAGAQVYTQAEWKALPVKPPAGTQVIISDDTSGGGGGSEGGGIADAIKVLNIKVQNSEYTNSMDLTSRVNAVMPEGYQFLTWTHVTSNGWITRYPIYCSNAGNIRCYPFTIDANLTEMPKESDKTISFFCLVVKK